MSDPETLKSNVESVPPTQEELLTLSSVGAQSDRDVEREVECLTRRSLMTGLIAGSLGFAGFSWLNWLAVDRVFDRQLQWPFRRMHQLNQWVSETVLGTGGMAPEFPLSRAREPRPNGGVGLRTVMDLKKWRLQVTQPDLPTREFTMSDIRALPKVEMVTELKCVEGWSEVVHWGGVRMIDFLAHYGLGRRDGKDWNTTTRPNDLFGYSKLSTPDKNYYVGLDAASLVHPQTLLCFEMNGKPLTVIHGAPLRLVITVKYGIKNIKRLGQISFQNELSADYWAERGYDWYAGL